MNTKGKENQPFEPHESRVKTPLKQKATSSLFLAEIQPAASCHLRTPPKPNEISPTDPWTPTANLKMLISAASPDIRNREQGKKLMDSRSESETLEDHLSGDEYEKSQPSRKEKSLGLLCHKFLDHFPRYPNPSENNEICLDEVAEELNVERRRIYDIMNVLESLHMVNRLAKNKYAWHGCHNLKRTLQVLKKVAEENKYLQQIQLNKKRECEEEPEGSDQRIELVAKHDIPSNHVDISFVELPGMEFRGASVNSRKDKSLRVMSQKFVMLFLVSAPQVLGLEAAAKILIGEDHAENLDKNKFKTKIRRLYDIANVLSSLDLIEKVHVKEEKGRKPAFKWTGPDVFSDVQDAPSVLSPTSIVQAHSVEQKTFKEHCSKNLFPTRCKQGFTRHPSLVKLQKNIQNGHRKIRSAPSSPIKKNTSHIPLSFPSKMAQLAAICKQQLDEQSRELKKTKLRLASSPLPRTQTLQPESCLKSEAILLPSHVEVLPLIHSSASPPVLPHIRSRMSYAVYMHPSQTQIATACNPSFTEQPVICANVIGIKCPAESGSAATAPGKMCAEGNDISLGESDAHAKGESIRAAKKREGSKDDSTPEKFLKRCNLVLEYSPDKKYKSEEVKLQDMLPGESIKNSNTQSSAALPLNPEVLPSSAEEQNTYKNMKQSRRDESKQLKQGNHLGDDSAFTAQEMPAHKAWFPSSYLMPLPQCTQLGNEITVSNKGKAEMCLAEQRPYSFLAAGGIPVTSEFTAVNLPVFHITPMNLMLPTSSVPTIPVINSTILPSVARANPIQASSSSVLNCTLQHFGVIPSTMQMSTDPGLGFALSHQGAERVSSVSKSVHLKQRKTLKCSHEINGKKVLTIPLQQTTVPITCGVSQEGNGKVFYAASKPVIVPSSCLSAPESNIDGSSKEHC